MLACAPKSNSVYKGIGRALRDLEKGDLGEVPKHLRDTSYYGAKSMGHGRGLSISRIIIKETMSSSKYLPDPSAGALNIMSHGIRKGKNILKHTLNHTKKRKK